MGENPSSKRVFPTGSQRDSRKGKGRFDLIPWSVISDLAKHFETGAEKYGDNNWKKGQPLSSYFDSAQRHLSQVATGETNENHLMAAIWNLVAMYWTTEECIAGRLPADLLDFGAYQQKPLQDELDALKSMQKDIQKYLQQQPTIPTGTFVNRRTKFTDDTNR